MGEYERTAWQPATEDEAACKACNGARYVRYERPVGNLLFGKYRPCPRCVMGAEVVQDARYGT